jgi:hypothetical protein
MNLNNEVNESERIQIRSIVAVERKFYFDMSPSKLGVLEFHPEPTFTTLEFERLPIAEYCWCWNIITTCMVGLYSYGCMYGRPV